MFFSHFATIMLISSANWFSNCYFSKSLKRMHSRVQQPCKFTGTKESVCIRNMAAVSLFCDTNMAAMRSCALTLHKIYMLVRFPMIAVVLFFKINGTLQSQEPNTRSVQLLFLGFLFLKLLRMEGGVNVSNNFTKRRQNGFKIGTRDKFATHLR